MDTLILQVLVLCTAIGLSTQEAQEMESCTMITDDMMGTMKPVFLATLTDSQTLTEKGDTVKFDNLIINREKPYNSKSGKFTAPVEGLYQLSVSILANGDEDVHVTLMKNTETVVNLQASKLTTATASIPLVLKQGDVVFVKHNKQEVQTISGGHHSYFSAFYVGL